MDEARRPRPRIRQGQTSKYLTKLYTLYIFCILCPSRLFLLEVVLLFYLKQSEAKLAFCPFCLNLQLIAECEQVKTERKIELNDQVLLAMSEMGLDRECTLQVRHRWQQVSLLSLVERHLLTLSLSLALSMFPFPPLFSLCEQMLMITTAPFTVCWLNASRNTRHCVLPHPHRALLAILSMLYR